MRTPRAQVAEQLDQLRGVIRGRYGLQDAPDIIVRAQFALWRVDPHPRPVLVGSRAAILRHVATERGAYAVALPGELPIRFQPTIREVIA